MAVTSSRIRLNIGILFGAYKSNQGKPYSLSFLAEISQSHVSKKISKNKMQSGRFCLKSCDSSKDTNTLSKSMFYLRTLQSTTNGLKMQKLNCRNQLILFTNSLGTTFRKCGCCQDLFRGKRLKTPAQTRLHTASPILSD